MKVAKVPRNYPRTMASAESGRPMTRGDKQVSLKIEGRTYVYSQPGWWCSLADPNDLEGQLVDADNQVADMARRTAKALAKGESVFVPVVIKAIRQRCGLTQRQAGLVFGGGAKSFEKYESGDIRPSVPTKRLLELALKRPELFMPETDGAPVNFAPEGHGVVVEALRSAKVEKFYGSLFAMPPGDAKRTQTKTFKAKARVA